LKSSATRTFNALANRSRDDHLTDHFGLVTDYLSECWTKLRDGTRISALQGRAHWGGALSGRDIEAVSKSVSGLLKLLFPNPDMQIYVSLYDQPEVWDSNGNMNPVRANVWAVKRNETGGHWIIEKQP
jgi:hypothetical protein